MLSRAKLGLYLFGNASCIRDSVIKDTQHIWTRVIKTLKEQQQLSDHLELKCYSHDLITSIYSPKDFDNTKEGGCSKSC